MPQLQEMVNTSGSQVSFFVIIVLFMFYPINQFHYNVGLDFDRILLIFSIDR